MLFYAIDRSNGTCSSRLIGILGFPTRKDGIDTEWIRSIKGGALMRYMKGWSPASYEAFPTMIQEANQAPSR